MCVAAPSRASVQYWVGFGSYRAETNAQSRLSALQETAALRDLSLKVVAAATPQGARLRVVGGPYESEAQARQVLAAVRSNGVTGTWLVVDAAAPTTTITTAPASATPASATPASATPASATPAVDPPERLAEPISAATTSTIPETVESPASTAPVVLETASGTSIELVRKGEDHDLKIDGFVDEAFWQQVPVIDEFVVLEPDTLAPGQHPTRMRVTYSPKGIYVAAEMEQPPETLVRRLSGRDVRDNRDSFSVTIDTSGEGRYGFWFGINLGDSLMDGTVLPERTFSSDWDGPWRGRSQRTDTGWSMEMYIPWGVVSMPASGPVRKVGMYVSRKVAYLDERWGWPALPPTQPKFMSALQSLEMRGVEPRQQYHIYPFTAAAYDWVDEEPRYRTGVDVFWRPSSNFQLNATVNPDFGIVESDDVVINLTATETFFPEKRLFFLEGQEIFVASPRADTRGRGVGNQGLPYTMVNTRRIGGKPRAPVVGANIEVPQRELVQRTELTGAVKTTGQFSNFRYGFMGAFEEEVKFDVLNNGVPNNLHQDGNDYGIARLLYENTEGGGYKALGVLSTAVLNPDRDAIAHGIDTHFLSANGKVKIDGQFMTSDIDGEETGYGGFLDFELTYRQGLQHRIGLEYFDEHIDINDLGFLQRNDEYRIRSALQWTRSDLSWARENQFDIRGFLQKNLSESLFTGGGVFLSNRASLNDLSQITARLNYFAPVFDDLNSFGNGTYKIEEMIVADLKWQSDTTRRFSVTGGLTYAEEKLGAPSYGASAGFVWRPIDQLSLEFDVRYTDSDGWLLHQNDDLFATFETEQWMPRFSLEYFINARQQFRIALQWVGIRAQEDEFYRVPARPGHLVPTVKPTGPGFRDSYDFSVSQYSLQLRYRWEIAPLSDIFLVYTRQADLSAALGEDGFNDIFETAWRDPLADVFVFKIRYRFGS